MGKTSWPYSTPWYLDVLEVEDPVLEAAVGQGYLLQPLTALSVVLLQTQIQFLHFNYGYFVKGKA